MSKGSRDGYGSQDESDLEGLKKDLAFSAESVESQLSGARLYSSAPSSPQSIGRPKVRAFVASIENLSKVKPVLSSTMGVEEELQPLKGSRRAYRGKITHQLNQLESNSNAGTLNEMFYDREAVKINKYLDKIDEIEMQMSDIWDKYDVPLEATSRMNDVKKSDELQLEVTSKLTSYRESLKGPPEAANVSTKEIVEAMSKNQGAPGNNLITCELFDGGKGDAFAFKYWLSQFENMLASGKTMANRFKLSSLRNHLTHTGFAFKLIDKLEINDDNYEVALQKLKDEFLDVNKIVDKLLDQLLENTPKYEPGFGGLKLYIADIRGILNDLNRSYNTDLETPGTGGFKLVSKIVYSKLPPVVQTAVIEKAASNYPTLTDIFDNMNEIIEKLNKTKPNKDQPKFLPKPKHSGQVLKFNSSKPALENFATGANRGGVVLHCKFCDKDGHSSYYCNEFKTNEQRNDRCKQLKLCFKCTSNKHVSPNCPGKRGALYYPCKICGSKGHVSAMCHKDISTGGAEGKVAPEKVAKVVTDVCFNTGLDESPYLLPIINLKLRGHSGKYCSFNFLFDTGSQRSYLSQQALSKLGCKKELVSDEEFEVKTFLGSSQKKLKEVNLDVFVGPSKHYGSLILVDDQFDISFNIRGFAQALKNFKSQQLKLAADFEADSDTVSVHGLVGVDIIQYLKPTQMINCLNGTAWSTPKGIIPFGNVKHFLYPNQIQHVKSSRQANNNFSTIVSQHKCKSTFVNFVLDPKHSYDDPFHNFFDDSMVERRVDKMLTCDSLGIDEKDSISDYDADKIKSFKDSIELINGEYHVDLTWHDNVNLVPSNEHVALNVLDRVVKDLEKKDKLNEYSEGIKKWEADNIIEKINVNPKDFKNYVWIPHRPVFKTDEQSTTKMRPVFNCSLKTRKDCPSLNEASYAGINLMKDMQELIMLFRTNHYVYLADVRKAFLMVKLKSIKDRNRFCFFMREGDKLVCYRFTTLLFGLNASPFILNYIIKHHANSFNKDECTDMLLNNFFVDNLVKSHNCEDKLCHLYKESVVRMKKGNFDLQSCNTNSDKLREMMIKDTTYVEHGCEFDKVLGYKYSPLKDVIKLAETNIDLMSNLVTKRIILSQFSKVFDPLSLTAPVTIRGKTLLSNIWKKKISADHWDEEVSEEDNNAWTSLSKDLSGLSSIEFPRFSLSEDEPADLFLFCDASKKAYGYVAYAVQNGNSGFVLSKAKVAPLQEKSLPTLELLGVFVAFKGLFSMLRTFSKVKFNNIYVAVDAQVVLSWLLSSVIKTKKQFVRNRIQDVHRMKKELLEEFQIPISFKYVPTDQNPGDLLTRGLSLEQFKQRLDFWVYGPKWIQSQELVWPSSQLNCLSEASKSIVLSTQISVAKVMEPLVPFERYSKFNKLVGVTAKMIEGLNKLKVLKDSMMQDRWGSLDPHQCAKIHLLRIMQSQCFSIELSYLKDPRNKQVPNLVSSLNLFIDKDGILRSDGRSGKCNQYEYDLINPILLAKDHDLTKLIIQDCHEKCQHLGIGSTLTKVRMSGFWIPKIRQAVKNVISPCMMCKRFNSLSFKYPKVTNLPKHRVNFIKPFQHTGIDYTGHIFVKDSKGYKKMYLLIFTCLNIRAVHIELLPDMDTQSLVLAIIRFTNIYGVPSHLYSDNARSFIAGCDVMKEIFLASEFCEHYSKYNIQHIRIPAYSAWVGSTWERMIRVIKSCLYKVVGRSTMGYYRLLTILSDIQNAVNGRPLTYRCSDDAGLEIITPNCFIKPYVNNVLFKSNGESILVTGPPTRKKITQTLISRDKILEDFRNLWYEEYLLSLREQWKDLHEVNFINRVKVNDVVLVRGPPSKKRPAWHLGRILEVFPGDDGKIRSVRLQRADGNYAHHSLNHLYPMELALTHDHVAISPDNSEGQVTVNSDIESNLVESQNPQVGLTDNLVLSESITPDLESSQKSLLDNVGQVSITPELESSSFGASVEEGMDLAEVGANSYAVDDQVLSQFSQSESPCVSNQDLEFESQSMRDDAYPLTRRPRRKAATKGRPLDDQFVFY